jgi:hypothetical protein
MSFDDGEPITIDLTGLGSLAGQTVTAILHATTLVDTDWLASVPVPLDRVGDGSASLKTGLSIGQEASVYVWGIATQDGVKYAFP